MARLLFSVDITDNVQFGSETVVMLKVNDDPYDMEIPRGKQYWEEKPKSIFFICIPVAFGKVYGLSMYPRAILLQ